MDTSKIILEGKAPSLAYPSRRGDPNEQRLLWPFSIANPQKEAVETKMLAFFFFFFFGFLYPIVVYLVFLSLVSRQFHVPFSSSSPFLDDGIDN